MFYISVESRDITSYCRDVVSILRHNASSKQRVTGLKLLDAWQGRGARAHRAEAVAASALARADMERVLVYMLLEGYIKEDFHFTAYTTISYLVPGTRAHLLQTPDHRVSLHFSSQPVTSQSNGATSKSPAASTKTQQCRPKRTPCVVNPNKSAFTTSSVTVCESICVDTSSSQELQKQSADTNGLSRVAKKRKATIVLDSSSDDDFDFGEIT